MSFIKRIMSAVLSVSIGLLSISAAPCRAVETDYIYNNTLSEKSKDYVSETEKPFNVFDIYNAYYGIVPITTAPISTSAVSTVTTTAVSIETTASSTNTTKMTAATVPTTTVKTTAAATQPPKTTPTTETKTTKLTTIPTTTKKTTAAVIQPPKTTPTTEPKTTTLTPILTTTERTTAAATQPPKTTPPTEIKTTAATVPTTTEKTTAVVIQPPKTTLVTESKTTALTTIPATTELPTTEEPTTTVISTTQETTEYTTSDVTTTAESTVPVTTTATALNGIDVSRYQLDIDWETAKASGEVEYAIIQAGYGKFSDQVDPYFHKNMQNAQAAGMDVGIYWFSYAKSVEDAKLEAQACLDVIKDYSFTYPIYYDFEYEWALKTLSVAELSAMVDAFCTIMEENGYYVGVYGSGSYLENSIYRHVLSKYDVWVAEYGASVKWYTGEYGMWQYTGSGTAPGVPNAVDKNYCYKDYPSIIGVNPNEGRLPVVTTPAVTQPVVTDTTQTGQSTVTTTTQTTATTTIQTTVTTTIPRGYIVENTSDSYNWEEFDKNSYQYAMLAVDSVQNLDAVKANIDAAHSEGIDCGILYLAEDANSDTVSQNAEILYNMLSTVKLEYPVYYWFDKPNLSDYSVGTAQLSENAETFCSYLEQFRYFVGIAAYDVPLTEQLDKGLFKKYSVWLFNEQGTPVVYSGYCGMVSDWDYNIEGYVHYRRENFPEIIAKNGLNGYQKE